MVIELGKGQPGDLRLFNAPLGVEQSAVDLAGLAEHITAVS